MDLDISLHAEEKGLTMTPRARSCPILESFVAEMLKDSFAVGRNMASVLALGEKKEN